MIEMTRFSEKRRIVMIPTLMLMLFKLNLSPSAASQVAIKTESWQDANFVVPGVP